MDAPPLERPLRSTPVLALAGVVHADPRRTFDALAARLRPADGSSGSFIAAPAHRTVILHGTWWYRGEWRVVQHEDGSRVEHELVNIAQSVHWAGPLVGRSVIREAPGAFQMLLSALVLELEES